MPLMPFMPVQIFIPAWHAWQWTKEENAAGKTIRLWLAGGLRGRRLVYRTSLYWALIKRMELRQVV